MISSGLPVQRFRLHKARKVKIAALKMMGNYWADSWLPPSIFLSSDEWDKATI